MSSVQLSVSTLQSAKGSFPQQPRRRVCRSLFGPVDHDELNRDIQAKLREMAESDQERWNFNFVSGSPLLGDYEWERTSVETTPQFYQESLQVGKNRVVVVHVEASDRDLCARDNAVCGAVYSPQRTRTGQPTSCKRKKTSVRSTTSRITGFYVKKRKRGDVKVCELVSHNTGGSVCAEPTPRKRLR